MLCSICKTQTLHVQNYDRVICEGGHLLCRICSETINYRCPLCDGKIISKIKQVIDGTPRIVFLPVEEENLYYDQCSNANSQDSLLDIEITESELLDMKNNIGFENILPPKKNFEDNSTRSDESSNLNLPRDQILYSEKMQNFDKTQSAMKAESIQNICQFRRSSEPISTNYNNNEMSEQNRIFFNTLYETMPPSNCYRNEYYYKTMEELIAYRDFMNNQNIKTAVSKSNIKENTEENIPKDDIQSQLIIDHLNEFRNARNLPKSEEIEVNKISENEKKNSESNIMVPMEDNSKKVSKQSVEEVDDVTDSNKFVNRDRKTLIEPSLHSIIREKLREQVYSQFKTDSESEKNKFMEINKFIECNRNHQVTQTQSDLINTNVPVTNYQCTSQQFTPPNFRPYRMYNDPSANVIQYIYPMEFKPDPSNLEAGCEDLIIEETFPETNSSITSFADETEESPHNQSQNEIINISEENFSDVELKHKDHSTPLEAAIRKSSFVLEKPEDDIEKCPSSHFKPDIKHPLLPGIYPADTNPNIYYNFIVPPKLKPIPIKTANLDSLIARNSITEEKEKAMENIQPASIETFRKFLSENFPQISKNEIQKIIDNLDQIEEKNKSKTSIKINESKSIDHTEELDTPKMSVDTNLSGFSSITAWRAYLAPLLIDEPPPQLKPISPVEAFQFPSANYEKEIKTASEMNMPRNPILCPMTCCNKLVFVSDFCKHIKIDHARIPVESIASGKCKNLFLDPKIDHFGINKCQLLYLVAGKISDLGSNQYKDYLPICVMSTRVSISYLMEFDDDPIPKNLSIKEQFLMIWLTGLFPTNMPIYCSITVWSRNEHIPGIHMVHSGELYSLRKPQDSRSLYNSGKVLLLSEEQCQILTDNGINMIELQVIVH